MGKGNVKNLGVALLKMLYKNKKVSIGEVARYCKRNKIGLEASEGGFKDLGMLGMGIEWQIVNLLKQKAIEPVSLTPEQETVLKEWETDSGEDSRHYYDVFESIKWKFREDWKKKNKWKKPNIIEQYDI